MAAPRLSRSALVNGWAIGLAVFALVVWFAGPVVLMVGGLGVGGYLIYTGLRLGGRWQWPLIIAGALIALLVVLPVLDLWFGSRTVRAS